MSALWISAWHWRFTVQRQLFPRSARTTDASLPSTHAASAESRHAWICHAYCLMTTHYHLILEATRSALSNGLCELNGMYARLFNQRHGRFGHLFADRYSTRVIGSQEYLYEACSYVLLNPVRAGLCDRIEDWPWSHSRIGLGSS
jgi:putative transposase